MEWRKWERSAFHGRLAEAIGLRSWTGSAQLWRPSGGTRFGKSLRSELRKRRFHQAYMNHRFTVHQWGGSHKMRQHLLANGAMAVVLEGRKSMRRRAIRNMLTRMEKTAR